MEGSQRTSMIADELILQKIFFIRSNKVMLDRDLADLYGVETKQLKRSVKRNSERFPNDFMFELTNKEWENLRCQFGTSSWGGIRYPPMAFTEQGIAMLSSVLNSKLAINVNIRIIRIFSKMRMFLTSHNEILQKLIELEKKDLAQDQKIALIFKYLEQLEKAKTEELKFKNRKPLGFKQGSK